MRTYGMDREEKRLPKVGQRIIKTSLAVLICLLIYYFRGYSGSDMSAEAMITAIICVQPYSTDSKAFAQSRLTGTVIGAVCAVIFLMVLTIFPAAQEHLPLVYILMSLGVMATLYASVALEKAESASLAAIVFLCIVISFPEIEQPVHQVFHRMIDTFVGTLVAIGVNLVRLPREKTPHLVFFLRASDLVPDRYAQIGASTLVHLNYLMGDGARICLITEHAPAFFTQQMNAVRPTAPMIVMDGAAVYDVTQNQYLWIHRMQLPDVACLESLLKEEGTGYSIYTIHRNSTYIFHHGPLNSHERNVYELLRTSPYRNYLESDYYRPDEVVYFKLVDGDEKIAQMKKRLEEQMPGNRFRMVIRPQVGLDDISGLYIYPHETTVERAMDQVMKICDPDESGMKKCPVFSQNGYRSERDALEILRRVGTVYEPVTIRWHGRRIYRQRLKG